MKINITIKQAHDIVATAINDYYEVLELQGVLLDSYLIDAPDGYILIGQEYVNPWKSQQVLYPHPTNGQIVDFKNEYIERLREEEEDGY